MKSKLLLVAALFCSVTPLALAQDPASPGTEDPATQEQAAGEEREGWRKPLNIESELTEDELKLLKQTEGPEEPTDQEKLPFTVPEDTSLLPEHAMIVTTKGPFEIKLFREKAPLSVANFRYLVEQGTYEGVAFHRYVPGFVIQGGDPTGTEKGGPGWTLQPEMDPEIHHVRGTLGWARLEGKKNPERRSNGSQFYICLQPQPRLDGFYSAFAVVIQGMENVDRLRPGDKILKVRFPRDYKPEKQEKKAPKRK